jgi:hypothetical protein
VLHGGEVLLPASIAVAWTNEAFEASIFEVRIPELFPVARSRQILLVVCRFAKSFC